MKDRIVILKVKYNEKILLYKTKLRNRQITTDYYRNKKQGCKENKQKKSRDRAVVKMLGILYL